MPETAVAVAEKAVTFPALNLELDVAKVKGQLVLVDPKSIQPDPTVDPAMERQAEEYATQLVDTALTNFENRQDSQEAIEGLGHDTQKQAAQQSRMLQQPIKALAARGEDGGPIAKSLIDLKLQVEDLDPTNVNFSSPSIATKFLSIIPGMGTPLKRYFARYESAQTVIDAIVHSLVEGAAQLKRDNVTLAEDQKRMRTLTHSLAQYVLMARLLDAKLNQKQEAQTNPEHRKFIQEELLFPLRQRTMDLQSALTVNQQGVVVTEIIMRNNQELVRGVNRAVDVTVVALQVAVAASLALGNQKIVLDKITMLNDTTSNLIAQTARQLREQGVEIHKQASSATLNMSQLEAAWNDVKAAMNDISTYRVNALPEMAREIVKFGRMAQEGEVLIQKMEKGKRARPAIEIGVQGKN